MITLNTSLEEAIDFLARKSLEKRGMYVIKYANPTPAPKPTPEPSFTDTAATFGKDVVLPYGGIGAVAGAGLSALRHYTQKPEDRKRSIWDALLTGGLTGAGVGMGVYGAKSLYNQFTGDGGKGKGAGGGAGGAPAKPKGITHNGVEYDMTPELATGTSPEAIAAREKLDKWQRREELTNTIGKGQEYMEAAPKFLWDKYPNTIAATAATFGGDALRFAPVFRKDPLALNPHLAQQASVDFLTRADASSPQGKALQNLGISGSTVSPSTQLGEFNGKPFSGKDLQSLLGGNDVATREAAIKHTMEYLGKPQGKPISSFSVVPKHLEGLSLPEIMARANQEVSTQQFGANPKAWLRRQLGRTTNFDVVSNSDMSPERAKEIADLNKQRTEAESAHGKAQTTYDEAIRKLEGQHAEATRNSTISHEQGQHIDTLESRVKRLQTELASGNSRDPNRLEQELIKAQGELVKARGGSETALSQLEALNKQIADLKASPHAANQQATLDKITALKAEAAKLEASSKTPQVQRINPEFVRSSIKSGLPPQAAGDPIHSVLGFGHTREAAKPYRGSTGAMGVKSAIPLIVGYFENRANLEAMEAQNKQNAQELFKPQFMIPRKPGN